MEWMEWRVDGVVDGVMGGWSLWWLEWWVDRVVDGVVGGWGGAWMER